MTKRGFLAGLCAFAVMLTTVSCAGLNMGRDLTPPPVITNPVIETPDDNPKAPPVNDPDNDNTSGEDNSGNGSGEQTENPNDGDDDGDDGNDDGDDGDNPTPPPAKTFSDYFGEPQLSTDADAHDGIMAQLTELADNILSRLSFVYGWEMTDDSHTRENLLPSIGDDYYPDFTFEFSLDHYLYAYSDPGNLNNFVWLNGDPDINHANAINGGMSYNFGSWSNNPQTTPWLMSLPSELTYYSYSDTHKESLAEILYGLLSIDSAFDGESVIALLTQDDVVDTVINKVIGEELVTADDSLRGPLEEQGWLIGYEDDYLRYYKAYSLLIPAVVEISLADTYQPIEIAEYDIYILTPQGAELPASITFTGEPVEIRINGIAYTATDKTINFGGTTSAVTSIEIVYIKGTATPEFSLTA